MLLSIVSHIVDKIVHVLGHPGRDIQRLKIKQCLKKLHFFFSAEKEGSAELLRECGYHISLQLHPSILFSYKVDRKREVSFNKTRKQLVCLRELIIKAPFYDAKYKKMLRAQGVAPYFLHDMSRMLARCGSPYVPYDIPERDISNEKTVVYTALTGNCDRVHEILYKQPGVDYILFTNNSKLKSKTWEVRYVESILDDVLLSREIKMLPDKFFGGQYTSSVYVDANAYIYGDITNLVGVLNDKITFAVTRHSSTDSVKKELDDCVRTKGVDSRKAQAQYEKYCGEGFKDDVGLAECGILVRRSNDAELRVLMEMWFEEFCNGVHRDQISLLPCIQRLKFDKYRIIEGSVWHNQFCIILGDHRRKK